MRSPRMSICAPTGVANFFLRAMCPSKASSAIAVTVSPTAARFDHGLRPNKLTAANPTATRRAVTLFGVHCIAICSGSRSQVHYALSGQTPCQPGVSQVLLSARLIRAAARQEQTPRRANLSAVACSLPCVSNTAWARLTKLPRSGRANGWRVFRVFVGELEKSEQEMHKLRKLE